MKEQTAQAPQVLGLLALSEAREGTAVMPLGSLLRIVPTLAQALQASGGQADGTAMQSLPWALVRALAPSPPTDLSHQPCNDNLRFKTDVVQAAQTLQMCKCQADGQECQLFPG